MRTYAGIGSRKLNVDEWEMCSKVGHWLAKQGWTLHTGAAQGADQAFAEGALKAQGKVSLFVPWPSYEYKWTEIARARGAERFTLQYWHKEAFASVDQYHPNPSTLKDTVRKLHARNYLIISECKFVIAFPKPDPQGNLGGTGQGIRIAEGLGIPVIRQDTPEGQARVLAKIKT